ncbi:MAG TPA: ATP-binding protein, partial [Candidatus Binatus sp.]|nr:ATP-binding protein [Candidatus Binatus sp.]
MVKSSDQWEKLSPYNQVRRRVEMYFGSRDQHTQIVPVYAGIGPSLEETTWVPAVFTAIREILDNAIDEVVTHRRGTRIDVKYNPADMTFSIADDGAGIPLDWSDKHQGYAPTILLSSMFSGRNFADDHGETRGLNGIGAKGVNYCSEWFQIEIHRNKKQFIQSFAEGDELQVGEPFIWPTNKKRSGTTIRFKLSQQVFPSIQLPEPFIRSRLREIAMCYPSLRLSYNGTPMMGNIRFENTIEFPIIGEGFNGKFWLVPDFVADGDFAYSLVNGIPAFNGGTHVDAFRRYFYSGLLDHLDRESRRRKLAPNRADISDGLLIFAVVEMANPSFDSQAKTRLINEPVAHLIRQTLAAPEFYKDIIRKHSMWIDAIYQRCAKRSQA